MMVKAQCELTLSCSVDKTVVETYHGKANMELSVGNTADEGATATPKDISSGHFKDTNGTVGSNSSPRGCPPVVGQVCSVIWQGCQRLELRSQLDRVVHVRHAPRQAEAPGEIRQ